MVFPKAKPLTESGGNYMTSESQRKAIAKYKQKVKKITIDFAPTETDILEHINKQPKKQTYIKNLIRKDMQSLEE